MSPKNFLLLIFILTQHYYYAWTALAHDHSFVCEADEKYEAYIASNLESLREKCSKLTDCIDRLLAEESAIVVLKGENISLNKTCGLIYKPEGGNYTTLRGKCSATERDEIRSDLETNIDEQLDNNRTWKPVNLCLKNKYGEADRTTRVEEICKLARIRKEICGNASTHRIIESFFNLEIQNLQCRCKLLQSNKESNSSDVMPVGGIVGIGIGCFIVLVVIFGIILFCYRRKHKLKSKKNNPNVIYMPAPGSDSAVYQELYDDRNYKGFPQSQPPSLPSRYVQHPSLTQDDSGYLEPVMAGMKYRPMPPIPGQASNPGYESPPRYSQYERESAAVDEDAENGYFKPLPDGTKDAGDDQATTTTAPKSENNGYEEVSGSRTSIPLEDAPVPANPVPAKRSKIEKQKEDSHYYVLESGATKDERNTV